MEPVRFIESDGMIVCGYSGDNVGAAWHKWETMSANTANHHEKTLPYDPLTNPGALEARFYHSGGEYDFVGCGIVTGENPDSQWEYLHIPKTTFAVFDIDHKIDQRPQFGALNGWLDENKGKYKRLMLDAGGKINPAEFVICVYDHSGKFGRDRIMEMWIPLVKI